MYWNPDDYAEIDPTVPSVGNVVDAAWANHHNHVPRADKMMVKDLVHR